MSRALPRPAAAPASRRLALSRLLGVWLACGTTGVMAAAGEVPVGGVLRDAELKGLNGPARRLSWFHGKPLLINVWASWCGPCREEAGSLERLAWSELGSRFNLIGISTDDDAQSARDWLRRSNATLNHYIDQRLEMETMLGASRLPLTVLVDANGRVLDKIHGSQVWDSPETALLLRRSFRLNEPASGTSHTALPPTHPGPDQRRG